MEEFTPEQIAHIEEFASAAGLSVREVKEAIRSILNTGLACDTELKPSANKLAESLILLQRTGLHKEVESAHVVDLKTHDRRFFSVSYDTIQPVKVENRDRIPVPNKYKRNRFQR